MKLPILALPLLTLLGACPSLEQAYPEKHYWVLEAERPTGGWSRNHGALAATRLRISPAFEGSGLVYRRADGTWESDYYNELFVPPAAMLTEATERWLAASDLFDPVVSASSLVDARWLLEGSVAALYADYAVPRGPEGVLELQLFLLDRDAEAESRLFFQGTYRARVRADGRDPSDLVQAWNAALTDVLTRFEDDLASRLASGGS